MTKPAHVVSTCNLLLFAERHRTRFADSCGRDCGRQNGDEQKAHANHGFPLEQIGYRRSAPALKRAQYRINAPAATKRRSSQEVLPKLHNPNFGFRSPSAPRSERRSGRAGENWSIYEITGIDRATLIRDIHQKPTGGASQ
jgi:hypothetical protein